MVSENLFDALDGLKSLAACAIRLLFSLTSLNLIIVYHVIGRMSTIFMIFFNYFYDFHIRLYHLADSRKAHIFYR